MIIKDVNETDDFKTEFAMPVDQKHVYTFALQVTLDRPIDHAEHGRLLAAKLEEVVEDAFEDRPLDTGVVEVVCRHPQEGTVRHMTME
jgi:hypothetical protein